MKGFRKLDVCLLLLVLPLGCVAPKAASGGAPVSASKEVPASREGDVRHRVERGQTLYRIGKAYGVSIETLMEANQLGDPRELKAGEWLRIPGASMLQSVPEYDSPEPAPSTSIPLVKRAPKSTRVGQGTGALQWPLRGVLYAKFGRKGAEAHDGIDLAAPAGTPVKTAAEGDVVFAGEQKGYGLIVIVQHSDELMTLYAHNRDVRVKTGQKVRDGQVVATVGDSGRTSGPHLHFEVRKSGTPVDPLDFLGPIPTP